MASDSVIQRAFAGGELSPSLAARADQVKYQLGLKTCRNFTVLRGGGVANRSGFRFIAACKTASPDVALLRYESETKGESILIEAGASYLRFFKAEAAVEVSTPDAWNGGTAYVIGDLVVDGGVNYYCVQAHTNHQPPNATYWYAMPGDLLELPNPFGTSAFRWVQSGRVITLTEGSHQPYELIFQALTRWTLQPVSTAPVISPPANLALTPGGSGTRSYGYLVTAAAADTYEESLVSNVVINTSVAAPTVDDPHVLDWDAVEGAAEYYVYCDPFGNQTYGYVGSAGSNQFKDTGVAPDFAVTPPIPRVLFAEGGEYPRVAGYAQQRRLFAFTDNDPDAVYGSRIGLHSNFNVSSPLQDDDAITFKMAGTHHHAVLALLPLNDLVVMTAGGEWTVAGDPALTPTTINPLQRTYCGSANVRPIVIGNSVIFLQARERVVRDLRFSQEADGFWGRDLTVFSSHLFDNFTITGMDFAQVPDSVVWLVRSDGGLLGLTYLPEHDVWGWHRHDTSGWFHSVCVVAEEDEDAVYVIVRRTIDGATVRYIERLQSRIIETLATDAFFVDSGLTYSGAPADLISGLDHLEGEVVAVLADGQVIFSGNPAAEGAEDFRVTGGEIGLPAEYSVVHVGLPITGEIETLELDVEGSSVRDKQKRIGGLSVLLDSCGRTFKAGPDEDHLRDYQPPGHQPAGGLFSGLVEMSPTSAWSKNGRIFIRQSSPLPLTVLGIIPHVELGG